MTEQKFNFKQISEQCNLCENYYKCRLHQGIRTEDFERFLRVQDSYGTLLKVICKDYQDVKLFFTPNSEVLSLDIEYSYLAFTRRKKK
jgi:hypothetical protein